MGGGDSKLVAGKPVVVVIGGGYGGRTCAKALDETGQFNVVVIDRKNYFLHNLAALRAVVEPSFAEKMTIGYDRLLKNGSVFQAEVSEVSPAEVRVHGREAPIRFDYLVIALGTSYAYPAKIAEPNRKDAVRQYEITNQLLHQRKNIVVVGGGPTGVELAGEISTDFPDKTVTLISSTPALVEGYDLDARVGTDLYNQLVEKKVNVILGQRVLLEDFEQQQGAGIALNYYDGKRVVRTDKGASVNADIVFMCIGPQVNNASIKAHFSNVMDESGRLQVDEYLRVRGTQNVFAVGDISGVKEPKMAFFAAEQAKVAAVNIANVHNSKKLKAYDLHPPLMAVTVGRNGGAGQLPMMGKMVVGRKVIKTLKSKTFFYTKQWEEMNQKIGHEVEGVKNPEIQKKNLASALGLSEDDAATLRSAGLFVPTHRGENHT